MTFFKTISLFFEGFIEGWKETREEQQKAIDEAKAVDNFDQDSFPTGVYQGVYLSRIAYSQADAVNQVNSIYSTFNED